MDRQDLLLLISKYLRGNATPEEHRFVETWYREMDSNRSIDAILSASEIEQLEQRIFENINARIRELPATQPAPLRAVPPARPSTASPRPIRRIVWLTAAAVLLIVLASGWWFLRYLHPAPVYATLSTDPGKVRKITLSDGSQIWLNAASRIRFAKDFSQTASREIFLEGEAYFEVARDEQHPFLVHTQNLTTRVLGTRFNVKAYDDIQNIEVTLLEGKVMLSAPSVVPGKKEDTLYLNPNEKALFAGQHLQRSNPGLAASGKEDSTRIAGKPDIAKTHPTLTKEAVVDAGRSISWREGGLIFDNASLDNVIDALSRKYNIHIHADSLLLTQPVTIIISPKDSAEGALLEITRKLRRSNGHGASGEPVQYRKEGSAYFIE